MHTIGMDRRTVTSMAASMKSRGLGLLLVLAVAHNVVGQVIVNHFGTKAAWPDESGWQALPSLNDLNDNLGSTHLDFVGDSQNPGGYWSADSDYLYFRMRVRGDHGLDLKGTGLGTLMIIVDRVGYQYNDSYADGLVPDYAFAWDLQEPKTADHRLEMTGLKQSTGANPTWGTAKMDDIDKSAAQKIAPPDFAWPTDGTTGDGYIRTTDSQSTVNFGTTTLVDFAFRWSYLVNNTTLGPDQEWRVQLGSINNANDHNFIDYDIAGGHSPSDVIDSSFGDPIAVPEPGALAASLVMGSASLGIVFWRRRA